MHKEPWRCPWPSAGLLCPADTFKQELPNELGCPENTGRDRRRALANWKRQVYAGLIPSTGRERDLQTLRSMIDEVHAILSTVGLPQGRAKNAVKILRSALALTDDLIAIANPPAQSPSPLESRLGGMKTAERGSEYFRQIAAKRKLMRVDGSSGR